MIFACFAPCLPRLYMCARAESFIASLEDVSPSHRGPYVIQFGFDESLLRTSFPMYHE